MVLSRGAVTWCCRVVLSRGAVTWCACVLTAANCFGHMIDSVNSNVSPPGRLVGQIFLTMYGVAANMCIFQKMLQNLLGQFRGSSVSELCPI